MTTITMTLPASQTTDTLFSWQSTGSTAEVLPVPYVTSTLFSWQSTGAGVGEVLSRSQIIWWIGLVQAPIIGVRHHSQNSMPNSTITPAPYKGPAGT